MVKALLTIYDNHATGSDSWLDTQPAQAACIVCGVWNKAIHFLWERRNLKQDYSVWHREMRICWGRHRNRCPLTCFSQQHHLLLHVLFSQGNKVPSVSAQKSSFNCSEVKYERLKWVCLKSVNFLYAWSHLGCSVMLFSSVSHLFNIEGDIFPVEMSPEA